MIKQPIFSIYSSASIYRLVHREDQQDAAQAH